MDEADHVRDVYAHYGLAMYLAQCLEQSMFLHLTFFDFFPRNVPAFQSPEHWREQFDRYEADELGKTMGRLIQKLKDAGQPTEEIKTVLGAALKERNRLAHRYFAEQAVAFVSESGRDAMIRELQSNQELFQTAAQMIDALTVPVARRYGFTEEMEQRVIAELMASEGGCQPNGTSDTGPTSRSS